LPKYATEGVTCHMCHERRISRIKLSGTRDRGGSRLGAIQRRSLHLLNGLI